MQSCDSDSANGVAAFKTPLQSHVVAAGRDCDQSPGVHASFVESFEDGWTDTDIESFQVWWEPTLPVASNVVRRTAAPLSTRPSYRVASFSTDSTTILTCQLLVVKVQLSDPSRYFTLSAFTLSVW